MTITEAMLERHAVRSFTEKKIQGTVKESLLEEIKKCNAESGLHIQLICDEPAAFDGMMAHYGKFSNCKNYIAIASRAGHSEEVGYYGEKVVLKAQELGLNSCWVAMSYSKKRVPCELNDDEKLQIVIALGYGAVQGSPHTNKSLESLCKAEEPIPDWFSKGMDAALLAPTAMNQQKFMFTLKGNTVHAEAGLGFYTKIDLGIVKYHFEIGARKENFNWA